MKKFLIPLLILFPSLVYPQITGEKFRQGFIIDKSGEKYEGLIRLQPGTQKEPASIVFKEGKKGKKEIYGTSYVKSFKIEADSFTVLRNIPMPGKKIRAADFAKVVLQGSGGLIYLLQYNVEKSDGHAATEYRVTEENSKYYLQINGKIAMLTPNSFKDVSLVVGDCPDLRSRIANRKLKFTDLEKVVTEYKNCNAQQ